MGCVTCTPSMEGVMTLADHQKAETIVGSMLEPNTLTGDPFNVDPEPFISFVYDSLESNKDLSFLIDAEDGRTYTFGDLMQRSKCWAQWLQNRGIGKGNVVSISSENDINGFAVVLGTWLSGSAANPINYNFTASDIQTMYECTEPDIVYCSKNIDVVEKAIEGLDKSTQIVTPGGKYPHVDFDSIMKSNTDSFEPYKVENSKEHVLNIMFTSGTTGIPKGIQIADGSLKVFSTSSFCVTSPVMLTSPMFWVSNLGVLSHAIYGCNLILIPKRGWTNRDLLQTIQTYKPKSWFTGHSVLLEMARNDIVKEYDLSSLETVTTGGTLQLANQRRDINEKVFKNKLAICHIYGSTEVGIATRWSEDIDINSDEYNSVGTLEQGVTMKVMSADGQQLGPRQEGELWFKTCSMTPGYMTLKRQIKRAIDENGWYHMGDLGFYDEKKLVYVNGRMKDILKYKGVQIAPVEIENIVNEHPEVVESCVVGKFDVIDGDQPVVFCVLNNSSLSTADDLMDFCKDNIAAVKMPVEVQILDSLPKNAVGKILRGELEKMVE